MWSTSRTKQATTDIIWQIPSCYTPKAPVCPKGPRFCRQINYHRILRIKQHTKHGSHHSYTTCKYSDLLWPDLHLYLHLVWRLSSHSTFPWYLGVLWSSFGSKQLLMRSPRSVTRKHPILTFDQTLTSPVTSLCKFISCFIFGSLRAFDCRPPLAEVFGGRYGEGGQYFCRNMQWIFKI